MFLNWPIRNKLYLGVGLLLVLVATLTASGTYGLYAYRGLLKGLRDRSTELPLATQLSEKASNMRSILSELRGSLNANPSQLAGDDPPWDGQWLRERFRVNRDDFRDLLKTYDACLSTNRGLSDSRIGDNRHERETLSRMVRVLARIDHLNHEQAWLFDNGKVVNGLTPAVDDLQRLAAELPSHLHRRLHALAEEVRLQYRWALAVTWLTSIAALLQLCVFLHLFYKWILQPLGHLIQGSRKVAAGDFHHRIHLTTHDEMSELAEAMNEMTSRFEATRDDLDRQVQERTKQVVRSEQLASVGFLAAGVAHEINNPLASIALCSESLQGRLAGLLEEDNEQHQVVHSYLTMIQDEAFRCKEITEKLLDFSRMGDVERHPADLRMLVEGVIDMVRHIGSYKNKQIELLPGEAVYARVHTQKMKQVVLNLLTNGLDSVEHGGKVTVGVREEAGHVRLTVRDDGCGMSEEVLEHLFEPFFTRRNGGQGTGLGLSITYRIVADHDGQIEATSAGRGEGSTFVVTLPLAYPDQRVGKSAA
ncbi:MAG: sensor histidine kinase [Pirellulales bacterium]